MLRAGAAGAEKAESPQVRERSIRRDPNGVALSPPLPVGSITLAETDGTCAMRPRPGIPVKDLPGRGVFPALAWAGFPSPTGSALVLPFPGQHLATAFRVPPISRCRLPFRLVQCPWPRVPRPPGRSRANAGLPAPQRRMPSGRAAGAPKASQAALQTEETALHLAQSQQKIAEKLLQTFEHGAGLEAEIARQREVLVKTRTRLDELKRRAAQAGKTVQRKCNLQPSQKQGHDSFTGLPTMRLERLVLLVLSTQTGFRP
jgi:hypothetical protein